MSEIFDFKDDLETSATRLKGIHLKANKARLLQEQESEELMHLHSELLSLANALGVSLEEILGTHSQTPKPSKKLEWDDEFFIEYNPLIIEARVKEEVYRNPEIIPAFSNLDYVIVGVSGVVATLLDFLIVKIPKDINYLSKYQQERSSFTGWLRTLGIDEYGELNSFLKWCENVCKVPYDQSINPNIQGFNPTTHRLLSLGHDPLFGLIFGILDILNGTMTTFDINGNIQILKTFDMPGANKVFAPFIWLGHIISDICTKMGVPIPGWAFLQLLQFSSLGSNNQTIADISRWMYLNGYDLRHLVTMSIPVAVIEIIVRGYHYLSSLETPEKLQYSLHSSLANRELAQIHSNLKLHKMLFLAHAIAASGNALKVFTYSGNPLAINLPQWILFIKESLKIIQVATRDKTPDIIIRNRNKINKEWEEIKKIFIHKIGALEANSNIYLEFFKD